MLFRTAALCALASVALAAEPQMLRAVQRQPEEEPLNDVASAIPLLMVPKEIKQEEDSLTFGKGTFGVKKGIKCDGGFEAKKGMKKHCEGGMEKDFSMSFTTSDLKGDLSQELMKQLEDFMPEPEMLVGVSDEEMEAQLHFDDDEAEVDAPKKMEFGGTMKAEWGCKVTFDKSLKGIKKKVECSAKFDAMSGKKEDSPDYYKEIEQEEENLAIGKSGTFGLKKGFKCDGGFEVKKGMKKHCEGGMEKDFSMSFKTSDLKGDVSQELMKQLEDFMPEPEMLVGVSDEEMEAQLLFDDAAEVDAPKVMEFGGTMKAEWGCKVTFEKSKKGVNKKVECSAKFDSMSGKKENSPDGPSVLDYFN